MGTGLIDGFEQRRLPGEGVRLDTLVGGSGPPLLLLHGYPQTRMCWAAVAPALAKHFTVVVPDLRGYGRSDKPQGGEDHVTYSKRTLAKDQLAVMHALGFERFRVAGHDRGGRVAYRLALDHPQAVERLAVLDIIPTVDTWGQMDAHKAVQMFHWSFLAQPDGLPERLIGADPEFFLRWAFQKQEVRGFKFPAENLEDYLTCGRTPEAVHGMCEDYRAGWTVDRVLDEQERGTRRLSMPLLVLWGDHGNIATSEPLRVWGDWADDVRGHSLPCGHFLPEEASAAVTAELRSFMGK